jgi:hypothetical protein
VSAAEVDARASTAAGDGLASARSGRRAVFVVRAADRFGNSVAAPAEVPGMTGFKADVTGSQVPSLATQGILNIEIAENATIGCNPKASSDRGCQPQNPRRPQAVTLHHRQSRWIGRPPAATATS